MMKWRVSAESSCSVAFSHNVGLIYGSFPYLKQAVDYLSPYIVFVSCEERRLEELVRAPGDGILRLDILPCVY